MNYSAYLEIIRPVNACVAGLAGILAVVIATGTLTPAMPVVFLIVLLVTGAGNVVNDYYDTDIDAVNRPDRPIPSGRITRRHAWIYAILLFIAGILIAFFCATTILLAITIINSLLLWIYAAYLKQTPMFGNIVVSYLSASIFLFGGAVLGADGVILTLPVAGATFFAMNSRELIKDIEDIPGDTMAGARTLPIVYGLRIGLIIAFVSCLLGVLISLVLYLRWGPFYLAGIGIVDLFLLYAAGKALPCLTPEDVKETKSASYLKKGMFASLLVFLLSAVFL